MLRLARAAGTRRLVATPHLFRAPFNSHGVPELRVAFAEWQRRLRMEPPERLSDAEHREPEIGLAELCVELAAEHHLSPELFDALVDGAVLTLGTGRRLLVELPVYLPPEAAEGGLEKVLEAGFQPLLAHVERYPLLLQRRRHLRRLLDMGCLLQVNAESIVTPSQRLRRACRDLLGRGWIHAVASDGHRADIRQPSLAAAAEVLSRRFGAARAHFWLTAGPGAILDGVAIPTPQRGFRDWWESF